MLTETEALTRDNSIEHFNAVMGYIQQATHTKPTRGHKTNPFLPNLVVEAPRKVGGILAVEKLYDIDGNEQGTDLHTRRYVDKEQFVKVMAKCFGEAFNMKSSGQKMLWVLLAELQNEVRKDMVSLDFAKYKDGTGFFKIGRTTFYEGLRELKKAKFIAEYKPNTQLYWVNPQFVFNGDRIRFVQEWVKRNPEAKTCEKPSVVYGQGVEAYKPELLRQPKV